MVWVLKKIVNFVGNLYWKVFGGIILWGIWIMLGVCFALTIIGFPIAILFVRISLVAWKPFGKHIAFVGQRPLLSIVWLLSAGMLLGVYCVGNMLLSMLSIVGLPLVKQWYKMAKVSLFPFFVRIV